MIAAEGGIIGRECRRPVAALSIGQQASQQATATLGDQEAALIPADDPPPPAREAPIGAEVEALPPRGRVHEGGESVKMAAVAVRADGRSALLGGMDPLPRGPGHATQQHVIVDAPWQVEHQPMS